MGPKLVAATTVHEKGLCTVSDPILRNHVSSTQATAAIAAAATVIRKPRSMLGVANGPPSWAGGVGPVAVAYTAPLTFIGIDFTSRRLPVTLGDERIAACSWAGEGDLAVRA